MCNCTAYVKHELPTKAYLSFVLEKDAVNGLDKINRVKSEIRRELGKRIGKQVRIIPELAFFQDDSAEYAGRIDQILSDLDIPEEENSEEDQ